MLFAVNLICCYLFLVDHIFFVSSKKQQRLSYHDLERQSDSNDQLFYRQFDHIQKQNNNNPCSRSLCSITNKCIRLNHQHNHTKFKPRCICREQPCQRKNKYRMIKMKSDFIRDV